jgi:IS1 family transposase
MKLPALHELKFLSGEFFLRAWRKYGRADQLLKLATASSRLVVTINAILMGDHSKNRESELIERIAEVQIYTTSIVTAFSFQNDAKTAIQAKLDELTDKVLKP